MILMALCAVLCGADTWVDVAEWAEDNEVWLRRYLVLERGTPCHDTFGRVFGRLDPKRSLRSRRKTADRLPDYRASMLGLTQ